MCTCSRMQYRKHSPLYLAFCSYHKYGQLIHLVYRISGIVPSSNANVLLDGRSEIDKELMNVSRRHPLPFLSYRENPAGGRIYPPPQWEAGYAYTAWTQTGLDAYPGVSASVSLMSSVSCRLSHVSCRLSPASCRARNHW